MMSEFIHLNLFPPSVTGILYHYFFSSMSKSNGLSSQSLLLKKDLQTVLGHSGELTMVSS